MRYFLIAYSGKTTNNQTLTGSASFASDGFPSNKWLQTEIPKCETDAVISDLVVTSIFEFKNVRDFDSYRKQ